MKKTTAILLVLYLVIFFNTCAKKKPKVEPTPAKQDTAVEKVDEKTPVVEKPVLTEEELIQKKSMDELNKEGNLQRVYFEFDKYFIKDDMKPVLQKNADWLMKYKTIEIIIEGHCDERGTEEYNIALGEKRAESAKSYLTSLGVAANRIKIVSFGKSRPLVNGVDEATWYQNRRSEFIIIKK